MSKLIEIAVFNEKGEHQFTYTDNYVPRIGDSIDMGDHYLHRVTDVHWRPNDSVTQIKVKETEEVK